jgi:hypothetical protein
VTAGGKAATWFATERKGTMAAVLELPTDTARTDSTSPEPDHQEIERRAYFRYLDRGNADGFAFDDWIAAETELRQEISQQSSSTHFKLKCFITD